MLAEAEQAVLLAQSLIADGRFESALQHASQSLALVPDHADALLCRGICEDALGLYRRSAATFAKASKLFPEGAAKTRCGKAQELAAQHLCEQTFGEFKWPELYEIDSPSLFSEEPRLSPQALSLPTAPYCHPACQIALVPGHGRGILTSADLECGTLIFASKAFVLAPKKQLLQATVQKLQICPRVDHDRFFCLFDGENGHENVAEDLNIESRPCDVLFSFDELPRKVDADRVESILNHNSHSRDTLGQHGSPGSASDGLCGVWLLAAFMNHSCRPNVERLFVGDMIICRAVRPIKAGLELFDSYISTAIPAMSRREALSAQKGLGYNFDCACVRCRLEACLIPTEASRSLLQQTKTLSEQIDPRHLNKSIEDFKSLATQVESMVAKNVESSILKLKDNPALRASCEELHGPLDSGGAWQDALKQRLERLLCGSFVSVWVAVAFAHELQEQHAAAADAYEHLCSLLEEVSPYSTFHASRAKTYAVESFRAYSAISTSDLVLKRTWWDRAVHAGSYAKRVHNVCYGKELWALQAAQLGWPVELISAMSSRPLSPETAQPQWRYSLQDAAGEFQLSIRVPQDADLEKISADVSDDRIVVTYDGVESLNVIFPEQIDPSQAQPVRYYRRGHYLLLKAPHKAP